jgi:pyridoxal 5'-phosphate synthase pdxT subunit
MQLSLNIGVLALQGGFADHLHALRKAAETIDHDFTFAEIRTAEQLSTCDALVIPGGESTTLSLLAVQSGLLEPLRQFVKYYCNPMADKSYPRPSN